MPPTTAHLVICRRIVGLMAHSLLLLCILLFSDCNCHSDTNLPPKGNLGELFYLYFYLSFQMNNAWLATKKLYHKNCFCAHDVSWSDGMLMAMSLGGAPEFVIGGAKKRFPNCKPSCSSSHLAIMPPEPWKPSKTAVNNKLPVSSPSKNSSTLNAPMKL